MNKRIRKKLLTIFDKLYKTFGPRHWWPGDTPFEIIVGAILTQNTTWSNVEKAIGNLKKKGFLKSPLSLANLNQRQLAKLIRPAGYYNIKAKRLKNFLIFLLSEFDGDLNSLFRLPVKKQRKTLLSINGIGPETADSIILYAAKKPVFVVDAYTKRVLVRHNMTTQNANYDNIQSMFMKNLPRSETLFNEYHALIVQLGKSYCRKKPLCYLCPLKGYNVKK